MTIVRARSSTIANFVSWMYFNKVDWTDLVVLQKFFICIACLVEASHVEMDERLAQGRTLQGWLWIHLKAAFLSSESLEPMNWINSLTT